MVLLAAWSCVGTLAGAQEVRQVVLPSAAAAADANTHLAFPWDCALSASSLRQQQIYRGTEIGRGEITELRFRQDAGLGSAFGPSVLDNVTIRLGTTDREIDLMSLVFSENLGTGSQIVYQGSLSLTSAGSAASPRPFDIVVPLQDGYSFRGGENAHLVLDVTLPSCASTTLLDAAFEVDDEVARIWETDATAAAATRTDTAGLVTQIVIQILFSDGFEDGNALRWSSTVP